MRVQQLLHNFVAHNESIYQRDASTSTESEMLRALYRFDANKATVPAADAGAHPNNQPCVSSVVAMKPTHAELLSHAVSIRKGGRAKLAITT